MFKFASFILLFIINFVEPQEIDPDGKIVGGDPYDISQVPWQVSMQESGEHICGGSLVDAVTVITAAHCCQGSRAKNIQIRAKSSTYDDGGEVSDVIKIIKSPKYNAKTTNNDVCILKLSTAILTTFVKLPSKNQELPDGTSCVVSGWGALQSESTVVPTQLQGVIVQSVNMKDCDKMYKGRITKSMICAAALGKDSCQGLIVFHALK